MKKRIGGIDATSGVSTTQKELEKRNEKKTKQVIIDQPSIAWPGAPSMVVPPAPKSSRTEDVKQDRVEKDKSEEKIKRAVATCAT